MNLLPGTEFSITCQIDPTHKEVVGYSSSDVYFTRSEELAEGGVSRITVPPEQYEVRQHGGKALEQRRNDGKGFLWVW